MILDELQTQLETMEALTELTDDRGCALWPGDTHRQQLLRRMLIWVVISVEPDFSIYGHSIRVKQEVFGHLEWIITQVAFDLPQGQLDRLQRLGWLINSTTQLPA